MRNMPAKSSIPMSNFIDEKRMVFTKHLYKNEIEYHEV